jgi:hypothetical protein
MSSIEMDFEEFFLHLKLAVDQVECVAINRKAGRGEEVYRAVEDIKTGLGRLQQAMRNDHPLLANATNADKLRDEMLGNPVFFTRIQVTESWRGKGLFLQTMTAQEGLEWLKKRRAA